MADNNTGLQKRLLEVEYVGTGSTDLTTNLVRKLNAGTGEMTARLKALIVAAGGSQ